MTDPESNFRNLTTREYFAIMAMQGILANKNHMGRKEDHYPLWAVTQADLLIKQLNSPPLDSEELLRHLRSEMGFLTTKDASVGQPTNNLTS